MQHLSQITNDIKITNISRIGNLTNNKSSYTPIETEKLRSCVELYTINYLFQK